jgi:DNA adenine methylase
MGSKARVLGFINSTLDAVKFDSVLDAFSGSGVVSYAMKQRGKQVYSNDFLSFCSQITKATIENARETLTDSDLARLLRPNPAADTFIRDTYRNLFFDESDCEFLDNLRANIRTLRNPHKKALALAAISRACMKKRTRGLFTFTGRKGWDGRKDLKLTMREQFLSAAGAFNSAVFDNGKENRSFHSDVFELDAPKVDLVYIDTPYVSPFSDCDYTRRYHFVEALCRDWEGVELQQKTKTKKIRSFKTAFATKNKAVDSFRALFARFPKSAFGRFLLIQLHTEP